MATAYVAFGRASTRGEYGSVQVIAGAPLSETVTTSAASEISSNSAPFDGVVQVFCDTPLRVTIGGSDALAVTATNSWYVPGGVALPLGVAAGDFIALVDA